MGLKIYVKSTLVYDDHNQAVREFFSVGEEKEHNLPKITTSFHYLVADEKFKFEINSIFEYEINVKTYDAFVAISESHKKGFPLRIPPNDIIKGFIDNHISEWDKPQTYFNLMRWVLNVNLASGRTSKNWSFDKFNWYHLFDMWISGATLQDSRIFNLSLLAQLANRNISEPLPFEILNEAKVTMSSTPRAALIMVATALEIGVKQFIKSRSPDTEWILENIQSPPVIKLISELVQQLEPRLDFSKETIASAKNLISERNKAIHSGVFDNSTKNAARIGEKMHNYATLVNDILYYLEFFSGHRWVKLGTHIMHKRISQHLWDIS
ncbi:hypothetical protein [Dyadobacter arcticus]|uniref:Apea-like HEPN domain-containing protein n=1 Tax=Dyadobacter arcticus TaxID=1078754 RepID=A0ABX0UJW3_9BACT|nr:hypothetical protein [Dyadobacter arcticus]NIJ51441.1 hypothetical protein [Dyadobacter arcticus]